MRVMKPSYPKHKAIDGSMQEIREEEKRRGGRATAAITTIPDKTYLDHSKEGRVRGALLGSGCGLLDGDHCDVLGLKVVV